MKPAGSRRKIQRAKTRVSQLQVRDRDSVESERKVADVLEELQATLEELEVAEEELRQQNEELLISRADAEAERRRFQDLFDSVPDGYLVLDAKGVICEANRAASRLLNVSQKALVGKTLVVFLGKEQRKDLYLRLAVLQKMGRINDWETVIQPRGREPFPASITITDIPAPRGRPSSFRMLFHDTTERKRVENALRESEEKARQQASEIESIYNSAPIGLCVLDRNLRFVRINDRMAQMNGIPAFGHIGKSVQEVVPDLAPLAEQLAESILRTGKPALNIEFTGTTQSQPGVPRHWVEHWLPIKDSAGKTIGINVVAEEITKRKQVEEELERYRDHLERVAQERTASLETTVKELDRQIEDSRNKDRHIRSLSARLLDAQERERALIARDIHDVVGGRLAAIKFSLEEKLKSMSGSAPSDQKTLEDIISVVRSTIEETRRISANLRPAVLDHLGLIAALTWMCREFHNTYDHLQVEQDIRVKESEIPEYVKTPAYRIIQEAFNNIAKHSEAGRAHLVLQKKDAELEVLITDDGKGFDPTRSFSKSHLGIAGMSERARLSGANLLIQSDAGEGTTVRVTWPLK